MNATAVRHGLGGRILPAAVERAHTLRMIAWGLWVAAAAVLLLALYVFDVLANPGAAGLTATLGVLLLSQAVRLQWLARRLETEAP